MDNDTATAGRLAALEAEVVRLTKDAESLGTRLSMEQEDHAETRKRADSLSASIINACTGSGCLNAHELRVALDAMTEMHANTAQHAGRWATAAMEHYPDFFGWDGSNPELMLANIVKAARADAKVLADEVRAWREADKKHDLIEVVRAEGEVWESMALQAFGKATDASGALERNR